MTQNPLTPLKPSGVQVAAKERSSVVAPGEVGMKTLSPSDIIRLFRQHMWLLMIAGLVSLGVSVAVYFAFDMYYPKHFSTGTMRVVMKDQNALSASRGFSPNVLNLEIEVRDHVLKLKSQNLLSRVVGDPEVKKTRWYGYFASKGAKGSTDAVAAKKALEYLEDKLLVYNPKDTSFVKISLGGFSYMGEGRDDLELIVSTVMKKYYDGQKANADDTIGVETEALKIGLDQAESNVKEAVQDVQNFRKKNDLVDVKSDILDLDRQMQIIRESLHENHAILKVSESRYLVLEAQAKQGAANPPEEVSILIQREPTVQRFQVQINDYKARLEVLLQTFGRKHPEVARVEETIIATEALLKQEVARLTAQSINGNLNQMKQQIEGLRKSIAQEEAKRGELLAKRKVLGFTIDEFEAKVSQRDALREVAMTAMTAYTNAAASRTHKTNLTIYPYANATDPELAFPKLWLPFVISFFLWGSVVGLLFVKEMADQRFKSPSDMRMLPAVKLLGGLPDAREDPSGGKHIEGVVTQAPASIIAESFRQIRAAIDLELQGKGHKTLMIASAQNACGVTQVIANLASSFAFCGYRVCVVDANFHSPGQAAAWQVSNTTGLAELMNKASTLDQTVQGTSVEGVSVITAGNCRGTRAEGFHNEAFRNLVAELKTKFDIVLFDTSPMSITSDGALLASEMDACALVIRAERETRGLVSRVLRMIDDRNPNFMGVILNGVKASAGGYFTKNYKAYYKYKQVDSKSA